jgi:hypothetical protein
MNHPVEGNPSAESVGFSRRGTVRTLGLAYGIASAMTRVLSGL